MSLVNILALHNLHVIKQITGLEVHERFRFILFKHDVVVNSWTIRTTASVTYVTFPVITKTRLLKYIEKSTTKKEHLYFSYFFLKTDCECSIESLRRGGSNEYPQSVFVLANSEK